MLSFYKKIDYNIIVDLIKKKIGLIHHSTGFGGGTKSFVDLVNLLSSKFQLIIFLPTDAILIQNLLKSHKIILIDYPIPNIGLYSGGKNIFSRTFLLNLIYSFKYSKLIASEINKEQLDYLILNTIVITPLMKYIHSRTKVVVYCRETIISYFHRLIYIKLLNRFGHAVFFISKQELIKFKGLKTKKLFLPDTYDRKLIGEIELHEKKVNDVKKIIYLGGLDIIKGFDTLLKSLKYFRVINFKIKYYGSFDKSKISNTNLIKLLIRLNLRDFLFFFHIKILLKKYMNFICFENYTLNIEHEIYNSDLLVFPSSFPHQARPFIEAGTLRTLVLISDFKETRDIYINNSNCLTFKPRDSYNLSKQIKFALSNNHKIITDYNYNFTHSYFSPLFVQNALFSFF